MTPADYAWPDDDLRARLEIAAATQPRPDRADLRTPGRQAMSRKPLDHLTQSQAETVRSAALAILAESIERGDFDEPTVAWVVGFLLRKAVDPR